MTARLLTLDTGHMSGERVRQNLYDRQSLSFNFICVPVMNILSLSLSPVDSLDGPGGIVNN